MDPALRIAASGMMAQQIRSDVIANNLANVNTTGFKGSRAHFQDLLYQTVQDRAIVGSTDSGTTPALQVGRGTRLASVQRLFQACSRKHRHSALPNLRADAALGREAKKIDG